MIVDLSLSRTQSRAAAIALLLVPVVIALWIGVSLIRERNLHHAAIEKLLVQRADDELAIRRQPLLDKKIAELRTAAGGAPLFYSRSQSSDATTRMETALAAIVSRNKGTQFHCNVEFHDTGENHVQELRASITLAADISALTHILYDIRQSRPLIFVNVISIKSSVLARSALTAPNTLQVEMTVVGYLQEE
jgi:hypothetical protein